MSSEIFETPMMKQYTEIKNNYPDCLLFFRLGDFYELFMDDAKIGAEVLDITLTSRDRGKDGRIPMAGVPFHAVDSYLSKLVKAGYKVAICEQLTEPDGGGLVERDVVRIVTPGTVMDESSLEKKENNYVLSISYDDMALGIAVADISTGLFQIAEYPVGDVHQILQNELSRLNPSECILSLHLYNQPKLLKTLKTSKNLNVYLFNEWIDHAQNAQKNLKKHLGVATLSIYGLDEKPQALKAAGALLGYLKHTQKDKVGHIREITNLNAANYLELDRSTILNLELFSTIREGNKKGSLIHLLDHTSTSMGGRMLRQWLLRPLVNKDEILRRHEAVEELILNSTVIEDLIQIVDIERLISRLAVGVGNARDLVNLKKSLEMILKIKSFLDTLHAPIFTDIKLDISQELFEVIKIVSNSITDEPPIDLRNGGLIKENVSKELDDLKNGIAGSKTFINKLEQQERERTGIGSLKVKFNQVFGYYIEITKSNLESVPSDYYRKQTLVNAERFITPELKHHEEIILTAEEKIKDLEFKLFLQTTEKILAFTPAIQKAAKSIATIDCLITFANVSKKENYVCPELVTSGELEIVEGRHPVVETLLDDSRFVPNDVNLNCTNKQLVIITGPNMAGKSVYIRQNALIVLLCQMGCFVPAKKARISIVDKIFVRSGASDVITSGLSTFMVEMVETANILHNATSQSLIVMDEIGRGTSTYDGVSIAWAVAEYLVSNSKMSPKTLFATHYHELQNLEQKYPNKIQNFQVLATESNGELNFLHKVMQGGASHSYGIAVARLAGVPDEVTKNATDVLHQLEEKTFNKHTNFEEWLTAGASQENPTASNVLGEMAKIDINALTPMEALKVLAALKEKISSSRN